MQKKRAQAVNPKRLKSSEVAKAEKSVKLLKENVYERNVHKLLTLRD